MQQSITTICIPRMKGSVTKRFIQNKMEKCNFGEIKSIVEKPLKYDSTLKRVILRLIIDKNNNGNYLLENTKGGAAIKVVYNGVDYWRLFTVD